MSVNGQTAKCCSIRSLGTSNDFISNVHPLFLHSSSEKGHSKVWATIEFIMPVFKHNDASQCTLMSAMVSLIIKLRLKSFLCADFLQVGHLFSDDMHGSIKKRYDHT